MHFVTTTLAIDGGRPVRTAPFPSWPQFLPEDIEAASEVLRSGRVNYRTGTEGQRFEEDFSIVCNTKHAVSVANGTVALELALRALGIGPGDGVITPCRSYVASTSCVVAVGATPVMADIDRTSQTITPATILNAMTSRTKAIIAVHLAGWPCDMDPIMELAGQHGLKVIEDCAQAQGAHYKGRPVGSLGHAGAFSFCQDKIMTTGGEGGMLTTNDSAVWERAWSYRDQGRRLEGDRRPDNGARYRFVYDTAGTNWRMTEMQSALGRCILPRVSSSIARRRAIAAQLNTAFSAVSTLRLTLPPPGIEHVCYRYYAFVRPERLREGWTRDRIMAAITEEGIPCFSGSCPEIYLEKAFEEYQPPVRFEVAKELGETSLAFLVHPTIQDSDVADMIDAVRKVMTHAST